MARIRTIKPEFFTSEDIVALSPLARLLYIAIWCEADKEGRMAWKPRTFKMRYLPADDCDIDALARELVASGLVRLYGDGLAYIPSFSRHQHINPRESASVLPGPHPCPRVDDASPRVTDPPAPASDAQGGREGKGKEGKDKDGADAPVPIDPVKAIFDRGVSLIGGDGRSARGVVGRLRKTHGDEVVMQAILRGEEVQPSDPIPWLIKACEAGSAPKPFGDLDDWMARNGYTEADYAGH